MCMIIVKRRNQPLELHASQFRFGTLLRCKLSSDVPVARTVSHSEPNFVCVVQYTQYLSGDLKHLGIQSVGGNFPPIGDHGRINPDREDTRFTPLQNRLFQIFHPLDFGDNAPTVRSIGHHLSLEFRIASLGHRGLVGFAEFENGDYISLGKSIRQTFHSLDLLVADSRLGCLYNIEVFPSVRVGSSTDVQEHLGPLGKFGKHGSVPGFQRFIPIGQQRRKRVVHGKTSKLCFFGILRLVVIAVVTGSAHKNYVEGHVLVLVFRVLSDLKGNLVARCDSFWFDFQIAKVKKDVSGFLFSVVGSKLDESKLLSPHDQLDNALVLFRGQSRRQRPIVVVVLLRNVDGHFPVCFDNGVGRLVPMVLVQVQGPRENVLGVQSVRTVDAKDANGGYRFAVSVLSVPGVVKEHHFVEGDLSEPSYPREMVLLAAGEDFDYVKEIPKLELIEEVFGPVDLVGPRRNGQDGLFGFSSSAIGAALEIRKNVFEDFPRTGKELDVFSRHRYLIRSIEVTQLIEFRCPQGVVQIKDNHLGQGKEAAVVAVECCVKLTLRKAIANGGLEARSFLQHNQESPSDKQTKGLHQELQLHHLEPNY